MGYVMRDRPDGQVEIVFSRPVLVGVFPERDMERICAMLRADEPPLPDDEPASFARAVSDVREAAEMMLDEAPTIAAPARQRRAAAPGVEERPVQAAQRRLEPHTLSAAQVAAAFDRIQTGEKIADVATSYGLSMGQLRGMWANHRRQAQKYMAEGGQQPCSLCARPFTPSVSNPDTCARCSHG